MPTEAKSKPLRRTPTFTLSKSSVASSHRPSSLLSSEASSSGSTAPTASLDESNPASPSKLSPPRTSAKQSKSDKVARQCPAGTTKEQCASSKTGCHYTYTGPDTVTDLCDFEGPELVQGEDYTYEVESVSSSSSSSCSSLSSSGSEARYEETYEDTYEDAYTTAAAPKRFYLGDDEDEEEYEYRKQRSLQEHLDHPGLHKAAVLPPPYAGPRPSTPTAFSMLFPSLDRLSIRHDDLSPDSSLNLRVDTLLPSPTRRWSSSHPYSSTSSPSRGRAIQLFHLRMHDLARRHFSLRRYCRNSGREVCSSRRLYTVPPQGLLSRLHPRGEPFAVPDDATPEHLASLTPTQTTRLEFANYARVDLVRRRDGERHDFEWWDHTYSWRRVEDKHLPGAVAFHLLRDGEKTPVAHIVAEGRSPNLVRDEEEEGDWVPPCYLWISDEAIIDALTDVADVIVATGLLALVDDSIRARLIPRQRHHAHHHLPFTHAHKPVRAHTIHDKPQRSLLPALFQRRNSGGHHEPFRAAAY